MRVTGPQVAADGGQRHRVGLGQLARRSPRRASARTAAAGRRALWPSSVRRARSSCAGRPGSSLGGAHGRDCCACDARILRHERDCVAHRHRAGLRPRRALSSPRAARLTSCRRCWPAGRCSSTRSPRCAPAACPGTWKTRAIRAWAIRSPRRCARRADAAGWLILPGDLPLVQPATLRAVARALAAACATCRAAELPGRARPPGRLCRGVPRRAAGAGRDRRARRPCCRRCARSSAVSDLAVDDVGIVTDIDTLDDLARAEALLARRPQLRRDHRAGDARAGSCRPAG